MISRIFLFKEKVHLTYFPRLAHVCDTVGSSNVLLHHFLEFRKRLKVSNRKEILCGLITRCMRNKAHSSQDLLNVEFSLFFAVTSVNLWFQMKALWHLAEPLWFLLILSQGPSIWILPEYMETQEPSDVSPVQLIGDCINVYLLSISAVFYSLAYCAVLCGNF